MAKIGIDIVRWFHILLFLVLFKTELFGLNKKKWSNHYPSLFLASTIDYIIFYNYPMDPFTLHQNHSRTQRNRNIFPPPFFTNYNLYHQFCSYICTRPGIGNFTPTSCNTTTFHIYRLWYGLITFSVGGYSCCCSSSCGGSGCPSG